MKNQTAFVELWKHRNGQLAFVSLISAQNLLNLKIFYESEPRFISRQQSGNIRAGQLLKIELVDHVIIGNPNHSSLRELGYFYS